MDVSRPPALGSAAFRGATGSDYVKSGVWGRALAAPSPPIRLFTVAELGFHPDLLKSIIRAVRSGEGGGSWCLSKEFGATGKKT